MRARIGYLEHRKRLCRPVRNIGIGYRAVTIDPQGCSKSDLPTFAASNLSSSVRLLLFHQECTSSLRARRAARKGSRNVPGKAVGVLQAPHRRLKRWVSESPRIRSGASRQAVVLSAPLGESDTANRILRLVRSKSVVVIIFVGNGRLPRGETYGASLREIRTPIRTRNACSGWARTLTRSSRFRIHAVAPRKPVTESPATFVFMCGCARS